MIRGDLADLRERLDPISVPGLDDRMVDGPGRRGSREPGAGSRGRRRTALDEAENVLLRHAAREARARNRRDVDLVLGGDLANQGSGLAAQSLLGGLNAPVPLRGNGGR